MGGEEVESGDRLVFGGNFLEKEAETWGRDGCGLNRKFLFLVCLFVFSL